MSTHCDECGTALDDPGTFHPALFCVIKQAWPDYDPWEVFTDHARKLSVAGLPERAPVIADLPLAALTAGQKGER